MHDHHKNEDTSFVILIDFSEEWAFLFLYRIERSIER